LTVSPQSGPTQLSGFLNLYKPPGVTSMDVVRQVKRLTGQRKRVGHGGTLDPLAEGVAAERAIEGLTKGEMRSIYSLGPNSLDPIGLQHIPILKIIEILNTHTTFETGGHLGDVLFEVA